MELKKMDWYQHLIDDCKSIITEAIFTSRWALVEGYWQLGKRTREDEGLKKWAQNEAGRVLQQVAKDLNISERTIYYALAFYDKYPRLDKVPEGKNITWKKLITKYLPAPKENKLEIPLPKGKYEVIIIDPPWPYGTEYNKETRRVASPYSELSIKELETLILPSSENCVLWLWTTHKFIWDAKRLMDLWGFEYKLILTWNKIKLGMGEWLRCQTEFCLLGIKGKPKWNLTNQRDIIAEAKTEHSKKPEAFYKLVEQVCEGRKLEMFARQKREGYSVYGDEL